MKNKYLLLLKMQLYNLFGINRILHSHSKKEKQRSMALGGIFILVIGLMIAYSTIISISLASMGAVNVLPTISALVCSLITLILTFLKSSGVLIGLRDYDMIMSLPVKNSEVVLSRLTMVYLTNLLISVIAVLPSVVIFGINSEAGISGNTMFLLSFLFLPVIPMIVSLGLGVLISAVSSRSKHKNILSLILSTLIVLLIVAASTKAQSMNSDEILNIGILLSNMANKLYPPAGLISKAVEQQNWLYFLTFVGMSALISAIFVGTVAHFYQKINTATFNHTSAKFDEKILQVSSPLKAMYKREFDRYFSCTIYALNSTIGMVLLLVVALLLLFISPEALEQQSNIAGLSQMLRQVLPLVISVFITMTSTASASLSLEGKNRWIICSAPVRTIDIFNSKIAVNLTVICPFALISAALLGFKMGISLKQAILLCIVPMVYACFISVLGMYMNVKFPKYDWTSEYYAVKGGAISVLATMGVGMSSSLIPLFICIAFQNISSLIMAVTSILLLIFSFLLYKQLQRYRLYEI
jgi:ABC-2 type transport system permease protein